MNDVLNSFVINGLTYKHIEDTKTINETIKNSGKFTDLYPVVFETNDRLGIGDHKYMFVTDTIAFSTTTFIPFDSFEEFETIIKERV